jgi:hypothetical protein
MQRVMNDLQRSRLSSRRMIWLLSPSPPPPVSKLDGQHVEKMRKRDNMLMGEGGRSQIIGRRESLVLYKSFNTLWYINHSGA